MTPDLMYFAGLGRRRHCSTYIGWTDGQRSVLSAGPNQLSSSRKDALADRGLSPLLTVGGIYTVIKTKAPVTCQEYGDRYTLIGPLSYKSAPMEVDAIDWEKAPADGGRESLTSFYRS